MKIPKTHRSNGLPICRKQLEHIIYRTKGQGQKMTNEIGIGPFCIGLGLGLAAGILWAPKSGAESRAYVRNKAASGKEFLGDQAKQAAAATTDAVNSGVKTMSDAVNTSVKSVSEAVNSGVKTIRHHQENLAAAVDAGRDAYREAVAATPGQRA
jgi:gas vesicle protein